MYSSYKTNRRKRPINNLNKKKYFQKRRERGRVSIRGIRLVEPAVINSDGGDSAAPDVSYFSIFSFELYLYVYVL